MNLKELKDLKKNELRSKTMFAKLPSNYYEECTEALRQYFKEGDFETFQDFQNNLVRLHELRIGKLLNSVMYRSASPKLLEKPLPNLLAEEEVLLAQLVSCIHKHMDDMDLLFDGYYLQEVR